ncbi:MAG: 30S ribosomal protein S4 [Bdellovibrionaceae bacterium]|nr:30S ribosomal protein S4 [Pseudobdellovibrionaceae bacterium]MBX3033004.1 30S ribosomal protein S4 [Pseudobdellovibrionaceae bacterium]
MKSTKKKKTAFKIQRRLMTELPGLGKAGALERRPYPPGEHGNKRRKFSEYALQMEEKQKVLFHYGLREKQLRRFVHVAKRTSQTNWVDTLIGLLEMRLDNLVFRLGFAPSIPAASQLISHGKVLVNGKKVDIRSAVMKEGDVISLKDKAYQGQTYLQAKQSPRLPLPDYLVKEEKNGVETGRLQSRPGLGHLPFAFDQGLLTSFYSLNG